MVKEGEGVEGKYIHLHLFIFNIGYRVGTSFPFKEVVLEEVCMSGVDIGSVGSHWQVSVLDGKDINRRVMVTCHVCETTAHRLTQEEAIEDLRNVSCSPLCSNCKNLRHSHGGKPAVPQGGMCYDILHICPNDGNKWWQANTHFHLWQQVTHEREWEILKRENETT